MNEWDSVDRQRIDDMLREMNPWYENHSKELIESISSATAEKVADLLASKLDKIFEDFCKIAAVGVVVEARKFFDENRADIATAIGAAVAEKWVPNKKGGDR